MSVLVNVADFATATEVLGPGKRALIWVQGCPRRCPGCITPHMQTFDVLRTPMTSDELARRILAVPGIEGVTFVGGEPFSQASGLAECVHTFRQVADLSVVTYSGYTRGELEQGDEPGWADLLAVTDLLIDGDYRATEACDLLWRGSRNQRLHFLTSRYRALAPTVENARGRVLEVQVTGEGQIRILGIPAAGFFQHLTQGLLAQGVALQFHHPVTSERELTTCVSE